MLSNRDLSLRASAKLAPNRGALTPGSTSETVDGLSLAQLDRLIDDRRRRRFRWTPVRRGSIPKATGKRRPLGLPRWRDKLLQEVIRRILEADDEPQCSDHSHGFRPGRGCHTALRTIQQTWTGPRWFIEGDIARCFATIAHDRLRPIVGAKGHDPRFLRLLRERLAAGDLEAWRFHRTLRGTPQGAVLRPLLSHSSRDRCDQSGVHELIPTWTHGQQRRRHPASLTIAQRIHDGRRAGQKDKGKTWRKARRPLPARDPHDPTDRRLRSRRDADDGLIGFAGPRADAEELKRTITAWLRAHRHLCLSEEQTLITQATTDAAHVLGDEGLNQQANDQSGGGQRPRNGRIGLRVPHAVVEQQCRRDQRAGKPVHRTELLAASAFAIVTRDQQAYRGVVPYDRLARNVAAWHTLSWPMPTSLRKTLARKHQTRTATIRAKDQTTTPAPAGRRRACLEVRIERAEQRPLIAQCGGLPLTRQPAAMLDDAPSVERNQRPALGTRLLAQACERWGSALDSEVHHGRRLAALHRGGGGDRPPWVQRMAAMQRQTLVVCRDGHHAIHTGRPPRRRPSA